jgi:hypothetical protein
MLSTQEHRIAHSESRLLEATAVAFPWALSISMLSQRKIRSLLLVHHC